MLVSDVMIASFAPRLRPLPALAPAYMYMYMYTCTVTSGPAACRGAPARESLQSAAATMTTFACYAFV